MEPPPPAAASVSTAGPRVDVSATTIDHLDRVTVTVTAAAPGDWLGVYCLEQDGVDEISATDFLDYRATSGADQETLEFGPLVNMRCAALQFQLRSRDNALVARASGVRFRKGPAEPTQRHLAVTALPTEMRVAWTSANVSARTPRVRYGLSVHALDREAVASGVTYDADDMCTAPATTRGPRLFRDPGVIYDATMTDLTPGGTYYYQVGSGAVSGVHWSDVRAFRVPPLVEGDARVMPPMGFFVFGDLMAPTDATRDFRVRGSCGTTMELIERDLIRDDEHQYAALIHVGDLSYAAGRTYVWDHFGALIEPVASRLPYMVSLGNHDFGYLEGREGRKPLRAPRHQVFDMDETKGFDAHGECGVPSEVRFRMPETGNGMLWYSFEMGLTHHTVLSGEHDFSSGSPMHTWLLQDLASVDRTQTPWLIVHLHRPLYCSVAFRGDFVRSLFLRDELERVFAVFRVDIVFSGHYHSYERTCPVYDDQCLYGPRGEARAPVHIMVGSGGANVDTYGHYKYGIHWSEAAKLAYGYGRLHVFNASHARFEFVENDARDVTDAMWIVTDHKWSVHDNWRWRRVVLHPSLWFLISTTVVMVSLIIMAVRRRRQPFSGGLRRHVDKLR